MKLKKILKKNFSIAAVVSLFLLVGNAKASPVNDYREKDRPSLAPEVYKQPDIHSFSVDI